jgi:HTH domain.
MILDTYPVVRERNMYKITEQLLALRDIPPGSKLLLVLLDNLSNGGGGVSGYTQLQLAEMLGVSRQSVNWDIQLLSAAGHIRVEGGRPACYFVLCQDACHSVSRKLTLAPFKEIVEQYNEVAKASGLIQCREVSEKRKVAMRRLWKKFKTIDAVRAYIEKVASKPSQRRGRTTGSGKPNSKYPGREEVIAKVPRNTRATTPTQPPNTLLRT